MRKVIKNQAEFNELVSQGVKDFKEYIYEGEILHCPYNRITALPELPLCKKLHCSSNHLTDLPLLPMCVELYFYNNQITTLPELPLCVELDCSNNKITALPELPMCEVLSCSNNNLTALPELPLCEILHCENNHLTALPQFTISQTSGRSVWYNKTNDKVLTGCFIGNLDEFYQKGYVKEGKEWVKDFYEKNKI